MTSQSVLFFFVAVAAVNAIPEWNGLRVTWNPNPRDPWAFASIPRDDTFLPKGLGLRDEQCNDGSLFRGIRFWYDEDPALTILYDINGVVAGIQTSVLKSEYTPSTYTENRNFADDGDYWTLTAYFVDPNIICSVGRKKEDLTTDGTGHGLWLQIGPDPLKDLLQIPLKEEEIKQTKWKFGKCFPTMGNHYWFNNTKDMQCEKFFPSCLLYNGGVLNAFCFSINANLKSLRYEHPTSKEAVMFIDPMPDCFITDQSYNPSSTIHVYMVNDPVKAARC